MATTAIWDVRNNLKKVIEYISNPEKTEVKENDYHYNGLSQQITYTTQDLKTEKQLYVTGINCTLLSAYNDMQITKEAFNKLDGIQAYHGYQSFKPGEVSAELAHQIGVELANEMWGENFEVLVSTHLDKGHYHNHFVINSVSFKDGKKYRDNKDNYKKLRTISDRLCSKYKLSIIDNPKNQTLHYSEWNAKQSNKLTVRELIKEDVDYAINNSRTMKQFYNELSKMNYEIKYGKYVAIKPKGKSRFFRLKNLDWYDNYSVEKINERIYEQTHVHFQSIKSNDKKIYHYKGMFDKRKKIKGFRALYIKYMYLLGVIPKKAPRKRVHFLLKDDIKQLDKITAEVTLLCKKKIDNIAQLEAELYFSNENLDNLLKERRCLYNKVKRCRNASLKLNLEKDIKTLSHRIKKTRKEVVLYEGIKIRTVSIEEKLREIDKERNVEIERKWRYSRSSR